MGNRHRHTDLKSGIARSVRLLGGVALSKLGTPQEGKGWPDLYIAHRLGPVGGAWLEVKVGRDRIRPEQAERIEALRASGAYAWVLREDESGKQELLGPSGVVEMRLEIPAGEGEGTLAMIRILGG